MAADGDNLESDLFWLI